MEVFKMSYPMTYKVDYPEKLSNGMVLVKALFGAFYVMIPHGFCLFFVGIAAAVVQFIAFWAILFTGKYPRGMFDFVVKYMRWSARVTAYMSFMRDEYPPFNGNE
jgi:hypothetical protein